MCIVSAYPCVHAWYVCMCVCDLGLAANCNNCTLHHQKYSNWTVTLRVLNTLNTSNPIEKIPLSCISHKMLDSPWSSIGSYSSNGKIKVTVILISHGLVQLTWASLVIPVISTLRRCSGDLYNVTHWHIQIKAKPGCLCTTQRLKSSAGKSSWGRTIVTCRRTIQISRKIGGPKVQQCMISTPLSETRIVGYLLLQFTPGTHWYYSWVVYFSS